MGIKKFRVTIFCIFLAIICWLIIPILARGASKIHTENLNITGNCNKYIKTITLGDQFKIKVKQNNKKVKGLSYTSTDTSVVNVTSSGVVTAISIGKANIKIYKNKHKLASMKITVTDTLPRTLFIGDSRTVYLFNKKNIELCGDIRDNIVVYARGGAPSSYINEVLNKEDLSKYDTVISWMGANDRGNFNSYKKYYKRILKSGTRLIIIKVGPVKEDSLDEMGKIWCNTNITNRYNSAMTKWAKKNNVTVLNLNKYITNNVKSYTEDGIHYLPKPNTNIWNKILEKLGIIFI